MGTSVPGAMADPFHSALIVGPTQLSLITLINKSPTSALVHQRSRPLISRMSDSWGCPEMNHSEEGLLLLERLHAIH